MGNLIDSARKDGSSLWADRRMRGHRRPAGWGAPVYGKLDADLPPR